MNASEIKAAMGVFFSEEEIETARKLVSGESHQITSDERNHNGTQTQAPNPQG
jgi:hypothetical protein